MRIFGPRHSKLYPLVICLCFALLPIHAQIIASAQPSECLTDTHTQVGDLCLRTGPYEISRDVCLENSMHCVDGLIQQLGAMKREDRCGADKLDALVLRQEIVELVTTAALQVDGFLAEIDSETGHIRAKRDELTDRRDTAVSHSTLGSAIGTGGGAVGSSLVLAGKTAVTGNWVAATFGGVGTLFSFLGFIQQKGPRGCFPDLREDLKKKEPKNLCHKLDPAPDTEEADQQEARTACPPLPKDDPCSRDDAPSGCSPRMLYALLFPECNSQAGFHSSYDGLVKSYLDSNPPSLNETRRANLIASWGDSLDKWRTSSQLFTSNGDPRKLSIDDLNERANKLADLRWRVSLIKRDLSRLTEDLAAGLSCR
jgi:hypothetical protein